MMKRMLAFLCVLALLMGMYVVPASATENSTQTGTGNASNADRFKVGYAKEDINPWLKYDFSYNSDRNLLPEGVGVENLGLTQITDDGLPENVTVEGLVQAHMAQYTQELTNIYISEDNPNTTQALIKAPMGGYSNSTERLSTGLQDDNADGKIGIGDGLFFTCTTVTDSNNYTLFMFTIDTLRGYTELRDDVAAGIRDALAEEIAVTKEQVTLSGSHTHGGVDFNVLANAAANYSGADYEKALQEQVDAWTEASEEYLSAQEINQYKLELDLANAQKKLWAAYYNYVVDKMVAAAVNAYEQKKEATMSQGSIDASTVVHDSGENYELNQMRVYYTEQYKAEIEKDENGNDKYVNGEPEYETDGEGNYVTSPTNINFVSGSHLNTFVGRYEKTYTPLYGFTYEKEPLAKADNTMYILQFAFDDPETMPIIMINWRAHATMMTASENTNLSADYINSLRYAMETNEEQNYRVAFIQGAGGNIIAGDDWQDSTFTEYAAEKNKDTGDSWVQGVYYGGTLLANAALECLAVDNMKVQKGSTIRAVTNRVELDMQQDDPDLVQAARNHMANDCGDYHPYPEIVNGKIYYINDHSHANAIITRDNRRKNGTADTAADITVSAFKLGDSVSIVTSPAEMYDRYSMEVDTLKELQADNPPNDWYNLKGIVDGTGEDGIMPLVFGYTNGPGGYIGNYISYMYNDVMDDNDGDPDGYFNNYPAEYSKTITDDSTGDEIPVGTIDGHYGVSVGSYEAGTSVVEQGGGEKIIEAYGQMLRTLADDDLFKTAYCQHCKKTVEWTPLGAEVAGLDLLQDGHYYLTADLAKEYSLTKTIEGEVCLDLNGHAITTTKRAFTFDTNGTVFSLMDLSEAGTGKVTSYTNNKNAGGVVNTYFSGGGDTTFNLYGGTLELVSDNDAGTNLVEKGGVVCLYGTMNMYGGTIKGGTLADLSSSNTNPGCGAAIYVYGGQTLNVFGGTIESGTLPQEVNNGDKTPMGACVYLGSGSYVTLAGNAVVDEIYVNKIAADQIKINDANYPVFTGSAALNINGIKKDTDIGNVSGTYTAGELTCVNNGYSLKVDDNDLKVQEGNAAASIGIISYTSIDDAIAAYNYNAATGNYIKLRANVEADADAAALSISKDVYLDLNGYNVEGVTVGNDSTLYCMDSQTDDYTVDDNVYGKITGTITGSVDSVPVGTVAGDYENYPTGYKDGYLKVTEGSDISFHRVNLQLTSINLRTKADEEASEINPGVYYKSAFAADEVVANLMKNGTNSEENAFGVALSVKTDEPTNDNMNTDWEQSSFAGSGFVPGINDDQTSTLLKNIMKESNPKLINQRNANLQVHGCAYILINGEYMFGEVESWNLKEVMAGKEEEVTIYDCTNSRWNTLEKSEQDFVVEMYDIYRPIMKEWNLENIEEAFQAKEDETLKVLVIGNSHGNDAVWLLNEVFKNEAPNQNVVLGSLYYDGCAIDQHKDFMLNNKAVYDYHKNGNYAGAHDDGSWETTYDTTAAHALTDEQWDIVVMQQFNRKAGVEKNYVKEEFDQITSYVKKKLDPDHPPKFLWHVTWTNPDIDYYFSQIKTDSLKNGLIQDYPNPDDPAMYSKNVMYEKIMECTMNVFVNTDGILYGYFEDIIPSCTAVEYADVKLKIDQLNLYRDYTHLSDYSRLMVAYLWYAKLTGKTEIEKVNVDAIPEVLHRNKSTYPQTPNEDGSYLINDEMKEDIVAAVNWTLKNHYTLTETAQQEP